jgi:hypothetical protein
MLNNRDAWLLAKKGFQDLPDIHLPRPIDEETDDEFESVISEIEENETEKIDYESEPKTAIEAAMRVQEMRDGAVSPVAQLELTDESESGKAGT